MREKRKWIVGGQLSAIDGNNNQWFLMCLFVGFIVSFKNYYLLIFQLQLTCTIILVLDIQHSDYTFV